MSPAQVKEAFLRVVDAPEGGREAAIDAACGSDGELKARVRALLRAHARAGDVLVEPTATFGGGERPAPSSRFEGTVIGPYTIRGVLGEGGFGTVYDAWQESPVRRSVALKVVKAGAGSRDIIARFEQERQALAVMDHPGIARVYDAGNTPDGLPYFVMEQVHGASITEFCDQARLTVRERVELFEQVCLAVQHAHSKGVLHRDLKPSNILVTRVDGRPFAKVIDFGIAKALHAPLVGGAAITQSLEVIGTPMYMPPEQATPDVPDIDARADVYSLGVVLYELLSGHTIFEPERLGGQRLSVIERIIREEDPVRPSVRVATLPPAKRAEIAAARGAEESRLARELAGDLDWIVMRALEKNRERRYGAPLALAGDLRRYLGNEPVEAGPPSTSYRLAKFVRRHRLELGAAGAVFVGLAALAVGAGYVAIKERESNERISAELARANALGDFSRNILSGVDPAQARGQDTTLLRSILAGAADRIDSDLAGHPQAAVAMLNTIGFASLQIADVQNAERHFRRAMTYGVEKLGPEATETLNAIENLGAVLTQLLRFEEAGPLLERVVEARTRTLGAEHASTLKAMSNLAYLHDRRGDSGAARVLLERLLEVRERTLGPGHEQTLLTMNNLASALDHQGETRRAAQLYERVLAGQTATIGEDHPRTLATMNNVASAYASLGERELAFAMLDRVIEIKRRVLPEGHPSIIISLVNTGSALIDAGRWVDAEPLLVEAVEGARRLDAGGAMQRIGALNALGRCYRESGRPSQALPLLEEAIEAALGSIGEKHPALIALWSNVASVSFEVGLLEPSRAAALRAIGLSEDLNGPGHPSASGARLALGRVLIAQGKREEGLAMLLALKGDERAMQEAKQKLRDELDAAIAQAEGASADPMNEHGPGR